MKRKAKMALSVATSIFFVTIIGTSILNKKSGIAFVNIDSIKNVRKNTLSNNESVKGKHGVEEDKNIKGTKGKESKADKSKEVINNKEVKNRDKDTASSNGGSKGQLKDGKEKNKPQLQQNEEQHKDETDNKDKRNIVLNSKEEVNKFAKTVFKKYFALDIENDPNVTFNIEERRIEETSENLWFCTWMGLFDGKNLYLNLLVDKDSGRIKKIDNYNYSEVGTEEKVDEKKAKTIALDFISKIDRKNLDLIGDVKVIKNSKDGYKVIIPKKSEGGSSTQEIIMVAVNPYSGLVSSFTDLWK
ncbi:hypothetical protein HAHI6034_01600 [Hathewaya histolytica]|uniref:Uncharacterized protein n=1 Tax=Hathewaya histolytica TaxID=1498 RepID=A0A4U9R0W5_HATHI|nr:hypothetical protein [Hathewaya histolytica]VTQ84108.1 Uncharacterised protein [Hathewaya histolytica]